jgi:hypothetical protein
MVSLPSHYQKAFSLNFIYLSDLLDPREKKKAR